MKYVSGIALNVKAILQESGYKQCVIAQKAGYSNQKFSDMLNGRAVIKDNDIMPIAKALGVTPNELFKATNDQQAS